MDSWSVRFAWELLMEEACARSGGKTEGLSNGSTNEVKERLYSKRRKRREREREREREKTERLRGSSINRDSGDWKPELSNAYLLLLLLHREKERGRLIYKRRDKAWLRRRERKPLSHLYSAARGSHASTDALRARTSSDCTPDVTANSASVC